MTPQEAQLLARARLRVKQNKVLEIGAGMADAPDRIQQAFEVAEEQPARPHVSRIRALAEGAGQGATLGFGDEIGAALDLPVSALFKGGLGDAYNRNLESRRKALEITKAARPGAEMVGEIGGGLATAFLPGGGAARAATLPARIGRGAATGAGYGAAYGVGTGEGTEDRIERGVTGGLAGGVMGAAAPIAIQGAIGAVRGVGNRFRGPARRVADSLTADAGGDVSAVRRDAANLPRLQAAGVPAVVADLGGERTRALARSAANTSPEARTALREVTDARFAGQTPRFTGFLSRIVGGADSVDVQEGLQNSARKVNRPAYLQAYRDGGAVWTPEVQQLASAPAVQEAIRKATTTGANRTVAEGLPPVRNPFDFDASGRMTLRRNPDGSTAVPTLQFWDFVQRNLRDTVTNLRKSAPDEALGVKELHKQLLSALDTSVPSFARARAGAAAFFKADNALDAGTAFVTSRMANTEARRGLAKMNDPEKRLFAAGYASDLIKRVREVRDRVSILSQTFLTSPAARERTEIALGPQRAREVESFLRIEEIMDRLRTATQGNSTTARQLAEIGLAGGAGVYGVTTDDWKNASIGGVLGLVLSRGKLKIDQSIARRVGEMLASDDPKVFLDALQRVARNGRLVDALREAHVYISRTLAPRGAGMELPYGAVTSHAEEDRGER